jgi:2-polyprenyl-6-methoxyphenol hydroxylase-like FAD-dependent oxidoreductase
MKKKDPGHYKFFNLATLDRKFSAPVDPERMRIRREGFRKLLLADLNVKWNSQIKEIVPELDGSVSVNLADCSKVKGKLLIGADGSSSMTRKFLCPTSHNNIPLAVRFIGIVVKLTPEMSNSITDVIDPLTFQGCHPDTGVYMFWCLVSTPESNSSTGSPNPYFEAQICVSWVPEDGEPDVPDSKAGKVQLMQKLCHNMGGPVVAMVNSIPEDSEPIEVKLQDWPCLDWDNYEGRVTLAGDSAHAMTMCK